MKALRGGGAFPPPIFLVLCFCGITLGVFGAFGATLPCGSAGCAVTAKIGEILGVESLLWGTAALLFVCWGALAILRRQRLMATLAGTALAADSLLLFAMLFFSPCRNCLAVAAIMGLCALLSCGKMKVFLVWLPLFLMNLGAGANAALAPLPAWGPPDAPLRIYLSPSCPSCREAALKYHSKAALYFAARNAEDLRRVTAIRQALREGKPFPEAFASAPAKHIDVSDSVQALQALTHVLAAGAKTFPFFEFHGLPNLDDGPVVKGSCSGDDSCEKTEEPKYRLKNPFGEN